MSQQIDLQNGKENNLLEKLSDLVLTIEFLFQLSPTPLKLLETKLSHLEQKINVDIANDSQFASQVITEWRQKLVNFQDMHTLISQTNNSTFCKTTKGPVPTLSNTIDKTQNNSEFLITFSDDEDEQNPTPFPDICSNLTVKDDNSIGPTLIDYSPDEDFKVFSSMKSSSSFESGFDGSNLILNSPFTPSDKTNKTMQSITKYLKTEFSQFTQITTAMDLTAMKSLIVLVANATKLIFPYLSNQSLHAEVFDFAFAKLPTEKKLQYREMKSLRKLILFMRHHIIDFHRQQWNGSAVTLKINKANGQLRHVSCKYCKQFGHEVANCPIIQETLCFKCFQYGHTIRNCCNEELLSLKWINSGIIND